MMSALMRWTGLTKLVSFCRYFAFNVPRVVTTLGVLLLLGIAAVRMYLVGSTPAPAYLRAYFALVIAGSVLGSLAVLTGRRPRLVAAGWWLGSVVSSAAIAVYAVGRTAGLPDEPEMIGRWDCPLGTFALAVEVLYLGLHLSVLTGMNVAYPRARNWHD